MSRARDLTPTLQAALRTAALTLLLMLMAACSEQEAPLEPQFSGGRSAEGGLVVTVTAPPSSMRVGETAQLSALVTNPAGRAVPARLSWSSSAPEIASVAADGVVSALAVGRTQITASTGRFSTTFTLDVVPDAPQIDLSVTAVTPATLELPLGQSLDVTVTIANTGTDEAPAAVLRLDARAADDALVATFSAPQPTLAGGASGDVVISMTPDASWPRRVRFVATTDADAAIEELDETNNDATSPDVEILAADLVIESVTPGASSVVLGCVLDVEVVVRNVGNLLAGATNTTLTLRNANDDVAFATIPLATAELAPGAAATLDASAAPTTAWPVQVALDADADADAVVVEWDDYNNSGSAASGVDALVAPPAGYTKLWICGAGPEWNIADRWQPAGVPVQADNVYVPVGTPHAPRLVTPVRVTDLMIEDGTRLDLASQSIRVYGHTEVSEITGPGTVFVHGAGTRLRGSFPHLQLEPGSDYMLTGATTASGNMLVWYARLVVGGNRVEVAGQLNVAMPDGGGLIMTDAADEVIVDGPITLQPTTQTATSLGNFSAGVIRARHNFNALAGRDMQQSFYSTGTRVVFDGTATQQVNLVGHSAERSRFQDVDVRNSTGGVVMGTVDIEGRLTMTADAILESLHGTAPLRFHNHFPVTAPGYDIARTDIVGAVTLERDMQLPNGGHLFTLPGGSLDFGGHTLHVTGKTVVYLQNGTSDGLIMRNVADELIVDDNIVFEGEGGSSAGNLTDGVIRLRGNFAQRRNHASFRKDVFVSTGTAVIFEGDGTEQDAAWHSPYNTVTGEGSFFHDVGVAPGAYVALRTFGHTYISGTADIAGRIDNLWGTTWLYAGSMTLRSTAALLTHGAICHGTLDREAGAQVTVMPGGFFGPAGTDPAGRGPC